MTAHARSRPLRRGRHIGALALVVVAVAWTVALFVLVDRFSVGEGQRSFCDPSGCRAEPLRTRTLVEAHGFAIFAVVAGVLIAVVVVGAALARWPGANPNRRATLALVGWTVSGTLAVFGLAAAIGGAVIFALPGPLLLVAMVLATTGTQKVQRSRRQRPGELAYVGGAMACMAVAMWEPNRAVTWLVVLAVVVTLPTAALLLPLSYGAAAAAWSATGADVGAATWPVTSLYVVFIGLAAMGNVIALRALRDRRRAAAQAAIRSV
jgi:hypothetical protein